MKRESILTHHTVCFSDQIDQDESTTSKQSYSDDNQGQRYYLPHGTTSYATTQPSPQWHFFVGMYLLVRRG